MSPTRRPPTFFKFRDWGRKVISLLMIKSLARRPCFGAMFSRLPLFRKSHFCRRRTAGRTARDRAGRRLPADGAARCRHRAGGKGLPCLFRRGGRQGEGVGKPRHGKGRHGAREAAGRQTDLACARRGGTGPGRERGRADGKPAAAGRGGACAARLHGCELGKRKAPHGAGLVRFTGRRGFMPAAAA